MQLGSVQLCSADSTKPGFVSRHGTHGSRNTAEGADVSWANKVLLERPFPAPFPC